MINEPHHPEPSAETAPGNLRVPASVARRIDEWPDGRFVCEKIVVHP
jgi:hypothetical protein